MIRLNIKIQGILFMACGLAQAADITPDLRLLQSSLQQLSQVLPQSSAAEEKETKEKHIITAAGLPTPLASAKFHPLNNFKILAARKFSIDSYAYDSTQKIWQQEQELKDGESNRHMLSPYSFLSQSHEIVWGPDNKSLVTLLAYHDENNYVTKLSFLLWHETSSGWQPMEFSLDNAGKIKDPSVPYKELRANIRCEKNSVAMHFKSGTAAQEEYEVQTYGKTTGTLVWCKLDKDQKKVEELRTVTLPKKLHNGYSRQLTIKDIAFLDEDTLVITPDSLIYEEDQKKVASANLLLAKWDKEKITFGTLSLWTKNSQIYGVIPFPQKSSLAVFFEKEISLFQVTASGSKREFTEVSELHPTLSPEEPFTITTWQNENDMTVAIVGSHPPSTKKECVLFSLQERLVSGKQQKVWIRYGYHYLDKGSSLSFTHKSFSPSVVDISPNGKYLLFSGMTAPLIVPLADIFKTSETGTY